MSAPPPASQRSPVDNFAAFTGGMLLFVPLDFFLMVLFSDQRSLFAGLAFLAGVAAVAWRTARTRWRWVGLGLAAGFGLMTLLTGGLCTLFGAKDDYPVGGLLYLGLCFVLLVVAAILQAVQSFRRRRPPSSPQP